MSDPRDPSGSPWQKPYHSRSDRAFITTMGFDTETFDSILNAGFTQKWVEKSILRDDNLHRSDGKKIQRLTGNALSTGAFGP